ncbi:blue copper protein isoform X2 [Ananas comosus]|uniref:Blue copper protein isoform X1 n=1 Tax=Ananas comosus TaxID=4615 RepID=A0A6P5EUZ7_ANACO|nr:blue copper protein isoform X1 [Ananas comosus]XP_020087606.1 blue copper protein isoform X2 [Ananas comosus]
MEQRSTCRRTKLPFSENSFSFCFCFCFCLTIILSPQCTHAYKNYTVGDSLGWYDNLMEPKVDYQKWASGKIFSLGDFLIFNTDKNHSVVQTYNATTYKLCDYNDASDGDTVEWSAGEPEFSKAAVTVAVPLLKEGPTYFFSGDYDGEQCENGQQLAINVTHGQGLPDSLKNPSDQSSPAPASPDDEKSVPDTVVPSNFDHPTTTTNDTAVEPTSDAGTVARKFCRLSLGSAVLVSVLCFSI